MRWLDDHDIEYEKLDVIADGAAFEEMVRISGQELAPVIEVDGKVLADFGPEELEKFWGKLIRKPGNHETGKSKLLFFMASWFPYKNPYSICG